jgi:thiamine transport system ATP-binding protein
VGLAGLGDRRPAELSGGQAGRAALARVLLEARPLVLLDEPFAALGPAQRDEMLDLTVGTLRDRGATLLMATHEPRDAARAGGVVVVRDGEARPPTSWEAAALALRDYLGEVRPAGAPRARDA